MVEAIAYAHSESILHRDIKPANIMIGEFGETVVVDWGLARDDKQPVSFARDLADIELASMPGSESETATVWLQIGNYSVSGKVVGTPTYMAPEQASGDAVTHKADIYALGSMLYEILAGAPPYPGKDPQVVLEKVLAGPPEPLSERDSQIPRELITIVQKAMAREPDNRYDSAKDLAEDLKLFQTGKLVSAHEYSTWTLMRRWLWRHRSAVAVALTALVLLLAVGAIGLDRVIVAKDRAQAEKQIATKRTHMATALQAKMWLSRDPTAAVAWLKRLPLEGKWLRKARYYYREAMAQGVARHVIAHDSWVWNVVFSADGKHVISASLDGTVRLIRVDNGAECVLERSSAHSFRTVVVSADGAWVAAGTVAGDIRLFHLGSDYEVETARTLSGHSGQVMSLQLTSDGRLLSAAPDGAARIWDLGSGSEIGRIEINRLFSAFSRDGKRVATARDGTELAIVDVASKAEILRLALPGPPSHMRFSPDGGKLVVLALNSTMQLIDIDKKTAVELGPTPTFPPLNATAFSPSGRWLAGPGPDWGIALFDLTGKEKPRVLRGHESFLFTLEFSRDETILVSANDDDTARVWNLASGQVQVLRGHADDVSSATLDPTGKVLATSGLDHTVRIWPLQRGSSEHLSGPGAAPTALLFGAGGELTALGRTGELRRWNTSRDRSELLLPASDGQLWNTGSRDGSRVMSWNLEQMRVATVSLATGATMELPAEWADQYAGHAFSDDGNHLMRIDRTGTIEVRNLESGQTITLERSEPLCGVTLSPDGAKLVISTSTTVELFELEARSTLQTVTLPRDEPACSAVGPRRQVYASDGSWVAISGTFGGLWVWNLASNSVLELDVDRNQVRHLAASPDSALLAASLRQDRSFRIWSPATGEGRILGHHDDLPSALAFSPNSRYLASASTDDTIRVWDRRSDDVRTLRGHTDDVSSIAFSRGSNELASGSRNGSIRVWNLASDPVPDGDALGALLELGTSAEIDEEDHHRPRTPRGARGTHGGPPCKDQGPIATASACNPCQQ